MAGVKSASVAQLEHQIVGNDAELRGKLEFIAWRPNHALANSYRHRCRVLRTMIERCRSEYKVKTGKSYPYMYPASPVHIVTQAPKVHRGGASKKTPAPKPVVKTVKRPIQYVLIERIPVNGGQKLHTIIVEKWGLIPAADTFPMERQKSTNLHDSGVWATLFSGAVWVTRNSVTWRKPTTGDKAVGTIAGIANVLGKGMPVGVNVDPNQHQTNLDKKKFDVNRLGYHESWDDFERREGDDAKEFRKYKTK